MKIHELKRPVIFDGAVELSLNAARADSRMCDVELPEVYPPVPFSGWIVSRQRQKVTRARAPAMNSLRNLWVGSFGSRTPAPGLMTYCISGWTTNHPVTCAE